MKRMESGSKLIWQVAAAGAVLGILGDSLLRPDPWGLNLSLWIAMVLTCAIALALRHGVKWPPPASASAILVLIFALGFAYRASPALKLLNATAITSAIAIWSWALVAQQRRGRAVFDYLAGYMDAAAAAALGAVAVARADIPWPAARHPRLQRRARSVALGVLLSMPLLFVFGGLLMAADAVFDQIVTDVLRIDLAKAVSHTALIALLAWVTCGCLLLILRINTPNGTEGLTVARPSIGIVEVALPLGLIAVLFSAFVVVQLRYLFGDASLVEGTTGLTYSEYARRGFFELVTVVTLVLPLLLVADWTLASADRRSLRIFRAISVILLVLLFAIMASAVKRMLLYQSAYGLTELRFYTTAFMAWLASVLAWFGLTVLRGQRATFATGAMVAGFLVIGALNIMNPDAMIAEVNTARAAAGEEFDASYATNLSADAVPKLLEILPRLNDNDRCLVEARLARRWSDSIDEDWRIWNYGRARARRATRTFRAGRGARSCTIAVAGRDVTHEPPPGLPGNSE